MNAIDFNYLTSNSNNFLKIAKVDSEMLWSAGKDNDDMLITILIITNSRIELFREALYSVINQNTVDFKWEILIMDNNPSETRILPIVKEINGVNIRYYRNRKNIGHEGNINRGFELAKGKWVAILHEDDLLIAEYLVMIKQYIDACQSWKKPLAYIRTNYILCNENDKIDLHMETRMEPRFFIRPELWCESLFRGTGPTFVNSCGTIVLREAFLHIGGYNDELYPIGDATLGFILMNNNYSIYATESKLGYYRQGSNESIKKDTIINFIHADYLLREYMYSRNMITSLWGKLFRKTQFMISVKCKNDIIYRYVDNTRHEFIKLQDIEYICNYEKSNFKKLLLYLIRGGFMLVYRPVHIYRKITRKLKEV